MSDIEVQLPDGSARALPDGASAHDLASAIGKRLAKDALAAQVNGQLDGPLGAAARRRDGRDCHARPAMTVAR